MRPPASSPPPRRPRWKAPEFLRDLGFAAESRLASRFTLVESGAMHSRSSPPAGGVPFVLIHGLVISSLYMIPLAERLASAGEVHALDLPGFGRSESRRGILTVPALAEAVLQWLNAAEIARCRVVANSLGCQVAAHVAAQAPHRVATVALIGATIDPEARELAVQVLRLLRDALREPPRLWANWAFDFCRAGPRRAVVTTRHMFADRIEEQLPRITAPTLIMRGENDPTMPAGWARRAVGLLPKGELCVIRGHAHCAHYTAPEEVGAAILGHVANQPA